MRVRIAVVTLAVFGLAACGSSGSGSTPQGTPIRTAPWETTVPEAPTTPMPTAYRTLPSVTLAPPLWAPAGWQTSDVDRFSSLVADELEALGADADVVVERGYALLSNGTRIPLTGLALRLAALPAESWREEVSSFLVTALKPTSPDDYTEYAVAGPLLRVRVGTPDALGIDPSEVVTREIAPGLVAALVIAAPDRREFVSFGQADVWQKNVDELLLAAISQTRAGLAEPHREGIYTSLLDDPFAAACILDPPGIAGDEGSHGFFVIIPNADLCLIVTIDRSLDTATVLDLVAQLQEDYATRADPVSDALYWWHDGTTEVVPVTDDELVLPEALAGVIR